MVNYICPRCSNSDKQYFSRINDKVYCRKCLKFIGKLADGEYKVNKGTCNLGYQLTREQEAASEFVLSNIIERCDCALNAVCGAGKTEIIYKSLEYCLNNNLRVGIAIPRKDVVIELKGRIEKDFNVKVVAVYGGCKDILEGDIVIFTTHQAYRYVGYFEVLIIDEVDAFPYNGDEVLKRILLKCSKNFVYLSATMPDYIEKDRTINKFYLNKRYHGYKLPVPKYKERVFLLRALRRQLKKYKDKVVLVYFPTIFLQTRIAKKIKYNYLINSKMENRENILNELRKMEKGVVLTTTVLERGITIKGAQVIVYDASHNIFDKSTLIQIAGRVGRSKEFPNGDVIFLCRSKNRAILGAIKSLKSCNE